jgi:hypothetical protein
MVDYYPFTQAQTLPRQSDTMLDDGSLARRMVLMQNGLGVLKPVTGGQLQSTAQAITIVSRKATIIPEGCSYL